MKEKDKATSLPVMFIVLLTICLPALLLMLFGCKTKAVANQLPPSIYHDCDGRVNTKWVNELAKCSGTNFIGVYQDMAAVWHPEDKMRYAGVAMFSTCPGYEGEYLKDISSKDFEAIFVNKTKPEYSK